MIIYILHSLHTQQTTFHLRNKKYRLHWKNSTHGRLQVKIP